MNYANHIKNTPQTEPIFGSAQVKNSAGGYSFAVDDWTRLDRFLILGTEGGSYYASERKLTLETADVVRRCLEADGLRTVRRIVEISKSGRAPKNDPAIFALAMAAKFGASLVGAGEQIRHEDTRKAALEAMPEVCRIGTHLLHFAEYLQAFGGWGRGTKRAMGDWYNLRTADQAAYQMVKYQSRDGWSHRDILRLAHPTPATEAHDHLFAWATDGVEQMGERFFGAPEILHAFERAKKAGPKEIVDLIREFQLPREAIPTEHLNSPEIWDALLDRMGLEALVRNLAKMTAVGLLKPLSDATRRVVDKLSDKDAIIRARLHPIKILAAHLTYQQGRGVRGSLTWDPNRQILDALTGAFYHSFKGIEPTGKRTLLALDVSGSMTMGEIAGVPGLTPRIASAAMAMVTARTERDHYFVGFSERLIPLEISKEQSLKDVVAYMDELPFGGTDCSAPIVWAKKNKISVDTFVVYTDSETWGGEPHPPLALDDYRKTMGIPAKLIVVGMVANEFSIADPNDAGMLDVVGFDTATPAIISDFSR